MFSRRGKFFNMSDINLLKGLHFVNKLKYIKPFQLTHLIHKNDGNNSSILKCFYANIDII